MGSKTKKITSIFDPSSGGTDIGGMIDPGGKIIKKLTGSDIGRKLADPAGVIPDDPAEAIAEAEAANRKQQAVIQSQKAVEQKSLTSAKDEVKARYAKQGAKPFGRSLLVTSGQNKTLNRAATLGGT